MTLAADLATLLGAEKVKSGEAVRSLDPGFHADNLCAGVIACPSTIAEVSHVLTYANARGIGVVPQGGRTGLAGGAASAHGQIILSLEKLNRIERIDAESGIAIVEAGVVLQQLDELLTPSGLAVGVDLGARGSATIGGMISTNAGGIEAFRNGVMRSRILGLEAVLADGTVISDMAQVTKCNEGYDVKQLFIGAEGSLGVVTRAVLRLAARPVQRSTALVSTRSAAHAVAMFRKLQRGKLIAFELMTGRYLQLAAQSHGMPQLLPLAQSAFAFIIEVDGSEAELAEALPDDLLVDAVLAKSEAERAAFWRLREDSWVVDRAYPGGLWFDISVPQSALDEYTRELEAKLAAISPTILLFAVGHLGDGNLHLTITGTGPVGEQCEAITSAVYDGLREMGGSISAEHGIGLEKKASLAKLGDPGKLAAMRRIKQAFDPLGIMNPGKVLELQTAKQ